MHLDGVIADDAAWQCRWRRIADQSASWYATPSGAVGRCFTEILAAGWWGVLSQIWNSERPLVFSHIVLTKMLGFRRSWEIQARITRRIDLWERFQHAGLVGDADAEGAAQEGRAAFSGKEEDNAVAWSFHETVFLGNLRQAAGQPTGRGEGVSSRTTNALKPGDQFQRSSGRITQICGLPLWKTLACAAFEEYENMPKMVPLDFTEDDVTWVVSKLSGAAGALGAQVMELRSWLLRFRCASK